MRKALQARDGERFCCRGTVERLGSKRAFRGPNIPTVLIRDLVDTATGEQLADHLWMTVGQLAEGIAPADRIEFDARVTRYTKGYRGRRTDDARQPPTLLSVPGPNTSRAWKERLGQPSA